jgi:hypothetical protein
MIYSFKGSVLELNFPSTVVIICLLDPLCSSQDTTVNYGFLVENKLDTKNYHVILMEGGFNIPGIDLESGFPLPVITILTSGRCYIHIYVS